MDITTYRMVGGKVEVKGLGYTIPEADIEDIRKIVSSTAMYLLQKEGHIRIFKHGKKTNVTAI